MLQIDTLTKSFGDKTAVDAANIFTGKPGHLPEGASLNGIQAHRDMFTTLASAAGVENVSKLVMEEKNSSPTALTIWPAGKARRKNRASVIPRMVPLVSNIRMDPFESYASPDACGHLRQKLSWLMQPMGVLMGEHLQPLVDYPPVQGGASFDMSDVVEDFV